MLNAARPVITFGMAPAHFIFFEQHSGSADLLHEALLREISKYNRCHPPGGPVNKHSPTHVIYIKLIMIILLNI